MNSLYIELAERIRGEIPDLDRVVSRVLRSWNEGQRFLDQQTEYRQKGGKFIIPIPKAQIL